MQKLKQNILNEKKNNEEMFHWNLFIFATVCKTQPFYKKKKKILFVFENVED